MVAVQQCCPGRGFQQFWLGGKSGGWKLLTSEQLASLNHSINS
jgi:hypothetical protein